MIRQCIDNQGVWSIKIYLFDVNNQTINLVLLILPNFGRNRETRSILLKMGIFRASNRFFRVLYTAKKEIHTRATSSASPACASRQRNTSWNAFYFLDILYFKCLSNSEYVGAQISFLLERMYTPTLPFFFTLNTTEANEVYLYIHINYTKMKAGLFVLLFTFAILSSTVHGACKAGEGDPYGPHPSPVKRVYDYNAPDKSKDVCFTFRSLFLHPKY